MIELINVSKYYPTDFGRHYVFRNVSLTLPLDKSVGVLGPNGSGKSTFLRLLGGADIPSEGRIIKTGSISPPMGLTPGLQASLTASENTRFAGRIYGLSRDEINDVIEFVRNLAGIGKFFDMPVGTYSSGMRQRVSFAINMSLNFDYYLFDEVGAGGDKEFRKISKQMVEQRLKTSKFVVVSHRVDELLDLCDAGIIIQNGELTYYEDIREALRAYGETDALEGRKTKRTRRKKKLETAEEGGTAANAQGSEERKPTTRELREAKRQKKLLEAPLPATEASASPDELADRQAPEPQRSARKRTRKSKSAAAAAATDQAGIQAVDAMQTDSPEGAGTAERSGESDTNKAPSKFREKIKLTKARREAKRLAEQEPIAEAEPVPHAVASGEPSDAPASTGSEGISKRRKSAKSTRRRKRRSSGESQAEHLPLAAETEASPSVHVLLGSAAGGVELKSSARRLGKKVRRQAAAPPPDSSPADLPEVLTSMPLLAGSTRMHRALVRQERARECSAEALEMLLRHLDSQDSADAALAVSAQERARLESAKSRADLETRFGGEAPRPLRKTRLAAVASLPADYKPTIHDPAERPDFAQ